MKKEYGELSALQTELAMIKKDEVQISCWHATDAQLADLESQIGENAAELEQADRRGPGSRRTSETGSKRRPRPAGSSMRTWVTPGASVVSR